MSLTFVFVGAVDRYTRAEWLSTERKGLQVCVAAAVRNEHFNALLAVTNLTVSYLHCVKINVCTGLPNE